ncbi:MAG TPA: DoxX family protein [Polyangiaceae bacterium]|nr:DoxX family protein [Polyangiaceae bacterium]
MRSKLTTAGYWTTTGLVSAACILGGAVDVAHSPDTVAFLARIGYPAYFAVLIGTWKVLGGAAILAPRLPRLKEWAYAGIFFDLTGAAFSHAMSSDGAHVPFPLVLTAILLASWALRPASRKLSGAEAEAGQERRFAASVRKATA